MIAAAAIHAISGNENMRMMQLARPREGTSGKNGTLNEFKFGTFFLSLIAEVCRIMCVQSIEKLVIAALVGKLRNEARIAISAPVISIETYGVPNLEWTFASELGNWPFLAIANETLERPRRFVRRTLTVATRAPTDTVLINSEFPVALAARAMGDPELPRTL